MNIAYITIEFTCSKRAMVHERIESVHFDRYGIGHDILSVEPGRIPDGHDECYLPEYRQLHGHESITADKNWASHVPKGCKSYVACLRLQDVKGGALTRKRVLEIPFGDRDLGFSIDSIGILESVVSN